MKNPQIDTPMYQEDAAAERERQAYLDEVHIESTQFGVDRIGYEEEQDAD
ncbi:hypothetical protein [Uliginosibacterium sp. H1]|nr:hypothetical protein [Uliginosibacterium sp. H1]